jgi:hypothetical protein
MTSAATDFTINNVIWGTVLAARTRASPGPTWTVTRST